MNIRVGINSIISAAFCRYHSKHWLCGCTFIGVYRSIAEIEVLKDKEAGFLVRDMTSGPIVKTMFRFAIPILIGQLLQMTYNMVDSIIVGRFIGELQLAAVAATYTPVYLFNAIIIGFTSGTSIIVSQYFGAKQHDSMRRTFSTSYIYIFIGGLLMSGIVFVIAKPLLKYVLGTPDEILGDAVTYMRVYYGGAVFIFLFNLVSTILRSLGDSVRPLWFLFISCIANIFLDILLVMTFHWGVAGAAFATVLSQALALVFAVIYIRFRHKIMWFKFSELCFDRKIFGLSIRMGIPESINQTIMSVCFMWQQRIVNSFGPVTIAAFLAGQRVDQLVGMLLIILGPAMSTFTGQNMGAGKVERIIDGWKRLMVAAAIIWVVMAPLLVIFGKYLLVLFVSDPNSQVIVQATEYLYRIAPFYIFLAYSCITGGILRGAGDVRFAMFCSIVGLVGRIGMAYLLVYGFNSGYNGVWLSTGLGFIIGCIPVAWRYYSGKWKTKGIVKQLAAVPAEG